MSLFGKTLRLSTVAVLLASSCHRSAAAAYTDSRCEMVERVGGPCILWSPSLIELISRPEAFDGRRVRVIGFVNFEFEGNGLYVHKEDWQHSIYANGLWINPPSRFESDSGPPTALPNQEYVIVEATFRAGAGGHFGMWAGTLENVTRLDPLRRVVPDTADFTIIRPGPA